MRRGKRPGRWARWRPRPPESNCRGGNTALWASAREGWSRAGSPRRDCAPPPLPLRTGPPHARALRRLVEGRGDPLALNRALHVGDLLRRRDEEDDEVEPGCSAMAWPVWSERLAGRAPPDQPRWPLPMGPRRSMGRVVSSRCSCSSPPAPLTDRAGEVSKRVLSLTARGFEVDRLHLDRAK